MDAIAKKTCLSDSFESQKEAARAVAGGLLTKEITPTEKVEISPSDIAEAKARRHSFAEKYGF